jgi:putative ATP-dependent endonuclease of OLD family
LTTHSPVALRELSGDQLFVMGRDGTKCEARKVGTENDIQSTIRLFPDAFLASSIIVGEGASEVGLVRGIDYFRVAGSEASIGSIGNALVDSGGGDADRALMRAAALRRLGYRSAVLRDDDIKPTEAVEQAFEANGGKVFKWRDGRTLEDELFLSLTIEAVGKLVDYAIGLHGEDLVDAHIRSASNGSTNLGAIRSELLLDELSARSREILGHAARMRRAGWFKSVTWMEQASREIVGPDLAEADAGFRAIVESVFGWAAGAGD